MHSQLVMPSMSSYRLACRRFRAELPKLSQEEYLQYRANLYGVAAVSHIPRVSLGRRRWSGGEHASSPGDLSNHVEQLTPQAREAARRTYLAGTHFPLQLAS